MRTRPVRWCDPGVLHRVLDRTAPAAVWWDREHAAGERVSVVGVAPGEPLVVGRDEADAETRLAAGLRTGLRTTGDPHLGWYGWAGYELGARLHGLPLADDDLPLAAFAAVDRAVVLDHDRRTARLVIEAGAADADAWLAATGRLVAGLPDAVPPGAPAPMTGRWRHQGSAYLDLVRRCLVAIRAGDAYQLCLTDELAADGSPDPLEAYARLRSGAAAGHGGVLRISDLHLLSASPEQYLRVDPGGRATTRPIKGTRPRSVDPAADAALAAELLASDKERAENLMIVDLMRNDLSRVSAVGSVEVTRLFEVESYPPVHQLVSTVSSQLVADPVDALLALFPAGSMTGAPKRSAMRLLAELERGPRGVYSGAWGRLGQDGAADLAVVIRSVLLQPGRVRIGAGGGIVADSDPDAEWAEVLMKAGPMAHALGIA